LELKSNLLIRLKKKELILNRGFYLYVGTAFGAGGLASRIHRHLRKNKKQHWHIDQVTSSDECNFYSVAVFPDEKSECFISKKLEKINQMTPIVGFGNSDCRNKCQSHFFYMKN
jgi:Uri superfamily endonuclease